MRTFSSFAAVVGMALGSSALAQIERVTQDVFPSSYPAMDNGLDVVTTRDGGCIVAGSDQGVIGGPMGAVRFDAAGNVVWERKYFAPFPYSHEYTSVIFSIQRCQDEGYIMAAGLGYFSGSPDEECNPMRLALIRIDERGNVVWAHRFEGLGYYRNVPSQIPFPGVQVRELRDGSFVAIGTGNTYYRARDGSCQPECPIAQQGVMARFDRSGTPIFLHRIMERGAGVKSRITLADLDVEGETIVVLGSVQKLYDCQTPDPAGSDLLLFTTDWNGTILTSYSYDTVNPAPLNCPSDPCQADEWPSSISVRDGQAFIGVNYPQSRVRVNRCYDHSDALIASIDYFNANINWNAVLADTWISYATLKFDAEDGEILFAGNRLPHDRCELHAYAAKWSVAGFPIWYQNYFDPRSSPTLFDIEALHSSPESRYIWMSGTQSIFTGPQLYLLGTDHNGKSECSSVETRIRQVEPRISVQRRPLELARIREEEIRVRDPEVNSESIDPCRQGRDDRDVVNLVLSSDASADANLDGIVDLDDLERLLR